MNARRKGGRSLADLVAIAEGRAKLAEIEGRPIAARRLREDVTKLQRIASKVPSRGDREHAELPS